MPTTVRHDIDALNAQLVITLPASEYSSKVNKDIKRYAQSAQIKGFRPGKAPLSHVKNMYGSSFLIDAVNKGIQEELDRYLRENPISMLGQPILSEDQEKLSLNLENPKDVVSKFDIGLLPAIELKGLDASTVVTHYEIQEDAASIDEMISDLSKRMGDRKEVEDEIIENDYITFLIEEIGGTIENQFGALPQDLTESAQKVVYGLKKGDKFEYNPFNFERNSNDKHTKTYFLGVPEKQEVSEDARFELTVQKVERTTTIAWGQAWFDRFFGEGNVTDENEARQKLAENLASEHSANIDALFFRDAQENLMAKNNIELPDEFLKRWILQSDEKNTAEVVEREYAAFAGNLRWSIIRTEIAKLGEIKPSYESLREFYKNRVRGYLAGMGGNEDFVNQMADRVMNDEKQLNELYEEVIAQEVFGYVRQNVSIDKKVVTAVEFRKVIEEAQARIAAERAAIRGIEMSEGVIEPVLLED
ncbi:MAG: hypothetical protein RL757_284 [Bacteroidota bacterium]|jgi:trigger factor